MVKEVGERDGEVKCIAVWQRRGGVVSVFRIYLENKGRKKWAGEAQEMFCLWGGKQ